MQKIISTMLSGAVALALSGSAAAAASPEAKAAYAAAKESAAAQYKTSRAKCDSLAGNPKDVCVAESKAAEKRAKAEAEATYKGTDKAHAAARKDIANAEYDVAKAKCGSVTGNDKDICIAAAKSARVAALEDAKAAKKIAEVRKDASHDKMDAEYKVAKEKCDTLAGAAHDSCMKQVKDKFNR